jgi:hypothetical protein
MTTQHDSKSVSILQDHAGSCKRNKIGNETLVEGRWAASCLPRTITSFDAHFSQEPKDPKTRDIKPCKSKSFLQSFSLRNAMIPYEIIENFCPWVVVPNRNIPLTLPLLILPRAPRSRRAHPRTVARTCCCLNLRTQSSHRLNNAHATSEYCPS